MFFNVPLTRLALKYQALATSCGPLARVRRQGKQSAPALFQQSRPTDTNFRVNLRFGELRHRGWVVRGTA